MLGNKEIDNVATPDMAMDVEDNFSPGIIIIIIIIFIAVYIITIVVSSSVNRHKRTIQETIDGKYY